MLVVAMHLVDQSKIMEWTPYIEYAMRVVHIELIKYFKKKIIYNQDNVITFFIFYFAYKLSK